MTKVLEVLDKHQRDKWRYPTEKQQAAGNYFKPRLYLAGLEIAIENPVGTTRKGRNEDGSAWSTVMQNNYGYIVGSRGVDGDEVDVYVGTSADSDTVYVIHQAKYGDWKTFDEDKCMLFFPSREAAEQAYLQHYDDPRFLGGITEMSLDKFKRKILNNPGHMIKSQAIDLSGVSCGCGDQALEVLSKAMSEDHDIWQPHENPLIRALIERFTERGLLRIETVKNQLYRWLKRHSEHLTPPAHLPKLPGMAPVWTASELSLVKLYLESLPSNLWTLSDYDYLVQYLFQRYLPADDLMTDAEWLTTRSHMMAKAHSIIDESSIPAVTSALPSTVSEAVKLFSLSAAEAHIMNYAKLRSMDLVVALSESARHAIKAVILDHFGHQLGGDVSATSGKLQQRLFDKFSSMNRDWRRIALTESNEAFGQGFIASLPPGTRVKRVEQYRGACPFCKKIDGMEFMVVSPDKKNKNDWTEMWVGKNNVGRSASPYKKTDEGLVKRESHELWVPTPGAIHPHCRGRLFVLNADSYAVSDEFAKWFNGLVSHG